MGLGALKFLERTFDRTTENNLARTALIFENMLVLVYIYKPIRSVTVSGMVVRLLLLTNLSTENINTALERTGMIGTGLQ